MFNFRRRHYHHHLRRRRIFTSTSADGTLVSGWCSSSMGRSKLHRQYYDQKRVGSYGGVAAFYGVTASHPIVVTDSVIHAHKRLRTIRSSTHRKYQSTIQHSTKFKFQFSRGSPAPTQSWSQIRSSTRTNDSAQLDHPPTANTSPPSSTRQISIF